MENEVESGNAGPEQNTAVSSNISAEDFANLRIGGVHDDEAKTEVEEDSVSEEDSLEGEQSESDTEEYSEQDSEDVLSQLNLEDMSEEELNELSQKLGSRAVARFGKLTARAKAAEERLQALEAELKEKQSDPLNSQKPIQNNPLSDIDSVEDLSKKADEANQVIEWAENILFESDGYSADDVVTEVEGQDLTKKEVRDYLLNARKTRDKFIPDQLRKIKEIDQSKKMKENFNALAEKELPWLGSEDNDLKKEFNAIMNDPRISQLDKALPPDISAQLPYLMAHAANSIYGTNRAKANTTGTSMRPPSAVQSSAGLPGKSMGNSTKKMKDVAQRFRSTGSKEDFVTLRTLQLSNR